MDDRLLVGGTIIRKKVHEAATGGTFHYHLCDQDGDEGPVWLVARKDIGVEMGDHISAVCSFQSINHLNDMVDVLDIDGVVGLKRYSGLIVQGPTILEW